VSLTAIHPDYPATNHNQVAESTLADSGTTTSAYGLGITPNEDTFLYSVNKHSGSNPTIAVLKTDEGNVEIATATFVGNTATFEHPVFLEAGTNYRIEAHRGGESYTYRRNITTYSFPYSQTYVDFVGGSFNGVPTAVPYNIVGIVVGGRDIYLDKLIPYTEYDWQFIFENLEHTGDYSYEYNFYMNDTNEFDGSEVAIYTDEPFTYGSVTDVNYTPVFDDVGNKFIGVLVNIYESSIFITDINAWTPTTRNIEPAVYVAIEADTNPTIPTNEDMNHSLTFESDGYPAGHYVEYSWGIVDDVETPTTSHEYDTNATLAGYDPAVTEYTLTHFITDDYVGADWVIYFTYYVYDDTDTLIDTNTIYSEATYDIFTPIVTITFYKKDDGLAGEGLEIYDVTNDETYFTDENSQFIGNIYDLNWANRNVRLEIDPDNANYNRGILDYYWNPVVSHDMNFIFLPSDDTREHEFLVRNIDDTLWTNRYLGFVQADSDANVVGIVQTNAQGRATIDIEPDEYYYAVLYNADGSAESLYENVVVTIFKPLDEVTLVDIDPYDVTVGGLLNQEYTNVTDANITFSIYAGVTDYYDVRVVDYNAVFADTEYLPRNYSVFMEMGSTYETFYMLQPFLINKLDAIVPTIKIVDQLNRSVPDALVEIRKVMPGDEEPQLVMSDQADSTGTISWTAISLDRYYISVYYDGVLRGNYNVVPRESSDIFWISIDISAAPTSGLPLALILDWHNTPTQVVQYETNPRIDAIIKSNKTDGYDSVVVSVMQDNVLRQLETVAIPDPALNQPLTFNVDTFSLDRSVNYIDYVVEIYDGTTLLKRYTLRVTFTTRTATSGFVDAFAELPGEMGQPLSAIFAIVMTILFIAVMTLTGLPTHPTIISVIGMFLIGFFMLFGFFATGTVVLGADVSWVIFVGAAIMTVYLGFREVSR